MGYLDNYNAIREKYKKFLTAKQAGQLLEMSREYEQQNAHNRVAAASARRTGFLQGLRGLQNIGMQSSGEVERLRRSLGAEFRYTNEQLNRNELFSLDTQGNAFYEKTKADEEAKARARARAAAKAAAERAKEKKARQMIVNSGTRGVNGGGGKMLMMTR